MKKILVMAILVASLYSFVNLSAMKRKKEPSMNNTTRCVTPPRNTRISNNVTPFTPTNQNTKFRGYNLGRFAPIKKKRKNRYRVINNVSNEDITEILDRSVGKF